MICNQSWFINNAYPLSTQHQTELFRCHNVTLLVQIEYQDIQEEHASFLFPRTTLYCVEDVKILKMK